MQAVGRILSAVLSVLVVGAFGGSTLAQTADNVSAGQAAKAVPARITQPIDETKLVQLKGNVHPLARAEFDQGLVSDETPMKRMMLVLQRSPAQEAALQQLMIEQMSKDSPNFHKWLTPQEFGQQFGPADADVQTITSWLGSHGFSEIKASAGRTVIEFSGNVGQVRNAFHTEIHKFSVSGEARQANVEDPQIPAALTPVVTGIVSLHNFPRKSMRRTAGTFTRTAEGKIVPQLTGSNGSFFALGPADFAKIYNIPSTLDGTGSTIAIIGTSDIALSDVQAYRTLFGPANDPVFVKNGPDPGVNGEEGEADLDVELSGGVAPKATVKLVITEDTLTSSGVDAGALYVIDNNNVADIMSLSFGACESALGAAGNAFFNAIWEEAAAQGITVMVSAGDNGSAGCDDFNTATVATQGLAVSGLASTPFNIAVGGTDFDDVGTQSSFWSSTNAPGTRESALGYIHEVPWNDSCAATATSANLNTVCATSTNIVAGSGGRSGLNAGAFTGHPRPFWQNGITPAADTVRDIPDVSLFASDGPQSKSFYVVCEADAVSNPATSCAPSGGFSFIGVGGTSASAPAFAGIMALVEQSERTRVPGSSGRQGNANLVLYNLAKTAANFCNSSTTGLAGGSTCPLYDITTGTTSTSNGNNAVPCAGNSTNCSSKTTGTNGVLVDPANTTTPAWQAGTGWDYATGLGSVNVANLATAWGTAVGAFKATTTSTKINGATTQVTITHGTSVSLSATVTTASGTPTGDVSFLALTTVNGGIGFATLSSGTATLTSTSLPGGSYNVKAHYAGDGTFAPSDDATGVPVVVNKENSQLQAGIVTFDAAGNIVSTNATNFAYGSPYVLRFDILNSSGTACQPVVNRGITTGCAFDATGSVTITDNGGPLDQGTFPVNSRGNGEDQPIQLTGGSHTVVATYSGDISYNAPAAPTTLNLTVSKATTTIAVSANPATGVTTATPVTLTATISSQSNSVTGTTGTVTFLNNGTQIGSPVTVTPVAAGAAGAGGTAALTTTFTTTGTQSITATYIGDGNYAPSGPSTALSISVSSPGSFTVTVPATTQTITAGSSLMVPVTVTPAGGFTGTVTVTCSGLPPGVTVSPNCAASPSAFTITVSGSTPVTSQLDVTVMGPSTTLTAQALPERKDLPRSAGRMGWLTAGSGLAALVLLLLPSRKRLRAALGLALVCILSLTLGCGGGGGSSTPPAPVATTTKITLTSPANAKAANGNFAFSVAVTGGNTAATGTVQFKDGNNNLGSPVSLSNGSATFNENGLIPVGTHSISAAYSGDSGHMASSSGALNVTVTGNTTLTIAAQGASAGGNQTLNITIN